MWPMHSECVSKCCVFGGRDVAMITSLSLCACMVYARRAHTQTSVLSLTTSVCVRPQYKQHPRIKSPKMSPLTPNPKVTNTPNIVDRNWLRVRSPNSSLWLHSLCVSIVCTIALRNTYINQWCAGACLTDLLVSIHTTNSVFEPGAAQQTGYIQSCRLGENPGQSARSNVLKEQMNLKFLIISDQIYLTKKTDFTNFEVCG